MMIIEQCILEEDGDDRCLNAFSNKGQLQGLTTTTIMMRNIVNVFLQGHTLLLVGRRLVLYFVYLSLPEDWEAKMTSNSV